MIIYALLIVLLIAAIWVKRDTHNLLKRSDELQKTLNQYIKAEQRGNK